jgi:hypothetical protein
MSKPFFSGIAVQALLQELQWICQIDNPLSGETSTGNGAVRSFSFFSFHSVASICSRFFWSHPMPSASSICRKKDNLEHFYVRNVRKGVQETLVQTQL